jgi:hypothetical protein
VIVRYFPGRVVTLPTLAAAQGLGNLQLQRIPRTNRLLRTTPFSYKHSMEKNKKQSPNSTNRTKQGQKSVLLVETIAWI